VRVGEAMVHGGPYPATNAPETTAVGPRSLERWCRPVCLQNWPEAALPEPLRTQP
jgi:NADP-dependent aldehyde dehydrogenase